MFKNSLIRERAMARKTQPEPVDDLMRVTAPREWMLLVGVAAVLAAVVLWGSLATIERTVSVRGVVLKAGERHEVVAPTAGSVSAILVAPGDRVEAGQPIAHMELPEMGWRRRVVEARISALESQKESLGAAASWTGIELSSARAELAEIEALESAGRTIVSPRSGELTALRIAAGQAAAAGEAIAEVRADGGDLLEAVGLAEAAQASGVSGGMEARVVCSVDGPATAFAARVLDVADGSRAVPSWLSRFGLSSGDRMPGARLLRVALDSTESQVSEGTPCLLEVILSRQTPLRLLISASGRAG